MHKDSSLLCATCQRPADQRRLYIFLRGYAAQQHRNQARSGPEIAPSFLTFPDLVPGDQKETAREDLHLLAGRFCPISL